MRLDKFLTELNLGTRSQVKNYLKQKQVTVNGSSGVKPEFQVNPDKDIVTFQGKVLTYQKYEYYLLNKPQGVLSAARDPKAATVVDLLPEDHKKETYPVGRLDKDTEGLLILTNDGEFAHRMLSPKKHVSKIYLVRIASRLSQEDILNLEQGIDLGEDGLTKPAVVTVLENYPEPGNWIHLSISEGKFHQVKRMLQAVSNEVLFLKRIRFGNLSLDSNLAAGNVRSLRRDEVEKLEKSAEQAVQKKNLISGKKAVIFDLDGSLIDSMWMWGDIDREYLGRFGIPLDNHKELQAKIEGMSFHQTAVYFKEHFGIEDPIEEMMATWNKMAWDKYTKEVPLKEGAYDFLEGCRRRGILLGIATSNSRELVEAVLAAHHLESYFSCILTGSEVLNGKPAPDIYLAAAKALSIAPRDCLVFEDILPGLMAGRSAGMTVCAVEDAYSEDTRDEKQEFADYYIEDYYDFF